MPSLWELLALSWEPYFSAKLTIDDTGPKCCGLKTDLTAPFCFGPACFIQLRSDTVGSPAESDSSKPFASKSPANQQALVVRRVDATDANSERPMAEP